MFCHLLIRDLSFRFMLVAAIPRCASRGMIPNVIDKYIWHTEEIDVVTVPVRFIRKAGNISCVPSIFGKLGIKQRRHAKSRGAIDQAKGVRFHVYLCSCGVRVRLTATSALSQAERRAPWEGCM